MRRIGLRNARRIRALCRRLAPARRRQIEALRALEETLASLRGPERVDFLFGPDLRAWLAQTEEALLLCSPGLSERRLFDVVAAGQHMADLLPEGRIDGRFRRRARALGKRRLEASYASLPALLQVGAGRDPDPFPCPTIPGSRIAIGRRLVVEPRGQRPGRAMASLARRLGDALALVEAAWPEAHRDVLAHTRVVIPFDAQATVSQSHADRPGVTYLNPRNRTTVDLADDLVHETAHHRLHSMEELGKLDRDDGEPRYHSPWRRGIRPLRGILHATYTFAHRARLLESLLGLRRRLPRSWIRRELAWEMDALATSLACLKDAERRGLLTLKGATLRADIDRSVNGIRRRMRTRARC